MKPQRIIALLGRRDEPTDAVDEYCRYLGEALTEHQFRLEIRRVPWEKHGWSRALHALRLQAASWRDTWVLVQYTALGWSARGFPVRFLGTLKILAAAGARIAVVYHDVGPYAGRHVVDRLRRAVQMRTMRRALDLAELCIFTVPLWRISWLPGHLPHAVFIPVGANLPLSQQTAGPIEPAQQVESSDPTSAQYKGELAVVGVFSITGGDAGARETRQIIAAVRFAAEHLGKMRLSVFGRHAELREAALREGLGGLPVEIFVEGLVDGERAVRKLSECDVLLFVRGGISTRRSSAIAGIACGLPVIAYAGSETAFPITDAGLVLASPGSQQELNDALVRVLSDGPYRSGMVLSSRNTYEMYFSWRVIAARYAEALRRRG